MLVNFLRDLVIDAGRRKCGGHNRWCSLTATPPHRASAATSNSGSTISKRSHCRLTWILAAAQAQRTAASVGFPFPRRSLSSPESEGMQASMASPSALMVLRSTLLLAVVLGAVQLASRRTGQADWGRIMAMPPAAMSLPSVAARPLALLLPALAEPFWRPQRALT